MIFLEDGFKGQAFLPPAKQSFSQPAISLLFFSPAFWSLSWQRAGSPDPVLGHALSLTMSVWRQLKRNRESEVIRPPLGLPTEKSITGLCCAPSRPASPKA